MDLNRRGMAAVTDAVMFMTVMMLVTAGLFAAGQDRARDVSAEDVCDDLLSVTLGLDDVYDTDDGSPVRLHDAVAGYLRTGQGRALERAEEAAGALVPSGRAFLLSFEYKGAYAHVGEEGGTPASGFSGSVTVTGGGRLSYTLWIY